MSRLQQSPKNIQNFNLTNLQEIAIVVLVIPWLSHGYPMVTAIDPALRVLLNKGDMSLLHARQGPCPRVLEIGTRDRAGSVQLVPHWGTRPWPGHGKTGKPTMVFMEKNTMSW